MLIKKVSGAIWPILCFSLAATVNMAQAESSTTSGLVQTLTLDGEVTGGSCDVDFPSTIAFADQDVEDLKDAAHAVTYNSLTPPTTAPTIAVTSCSPMQMFTVTLVGSVDNNDAQALANDASEGPAHNVGMRAFIGSDDNAVQMTPNVASKAYSADEKGEMNLPFWPGLLKTTASPTPGAVHVTGQLDIDYL